MKKMLYLMIVMLMLAMLNTLSACGKVSEAQPMPGSGYPHSYPRR